MEQIDIPQERRYCSKLGFSVLAIMLWSILWQFGLYWLDGWILPFRMQETLYYLLLLVGHYAVSLPIVFCLWRKTPPMPFCRERAGAKRMGRLVCHRLCADVARLAHRHEYQRHGLHLDRTRSGRHGGREFFADVHDGHRSRCLHYRSAVRGAGVPRPAGRPSRAVRAEAGRLHFCAAVRPVSRQSGAVFYALRSVCCCPMRTTAPDCCAPRCCCTCCSTSSARWCPCCCRIP